MKLVKQSYFLNVNPILKGKENNLKDLFILCRCLLKNCRNFPSGEWPFKEIFYEQKDKSCIACLQSSGYEWKHFGNLSARAISGSSQTGLALMFVVLKSTACVKHTKNTFENDVLVYRIESFALCTVELVRYHTLLNPGFHALSYKCLMYFYFLEKTNKNKWKLT